MVQRLSQQCEAQADRLYNDPNNLTAWGWIHWTYRGGFLNDCLAAKKRWVMQTHLRLLQARIAKLSARRDQSLSADIRGLQQGQKAYQARMVDEAEKYKDGCYERLGLNETSESLPRQIRRLLTEYFEMRAEMELEGTI